MAFAIEKIGDIIKLMSETGDIPKSITLDLSDDRNFYQTRLYYDFYDKTTKKVYEGYIECKSKFPTFINDFDIVLDQKEDADTIFTIIIPGVEEF